jgi:hypothetical protein
VSGEKKRGLPPRRASRWHQTQALFADVGERARRRGQKAFLQVKIDTLDGVTS